MQRIFFTIITSVLCLGAAAQKYNIEFVTHPDTSTSPVTDLTLVPMGGARLRVSAIPVIR